MPCSSRLHATGRRLEGQRRGAVKGRGSRAPLRESGLMVTAQPLLNYLVALGYGRGKTACGGCQPAGNRAEAAACGPASPAARSPTTEPPGAVHPRTYAADGAPLGAPAPLLGTPGHVH